MPLLTVLLKVIDEIGEKTALSIVNFFSDNEKIVMINKLKNSGVDFKTSSKKSGVLNGVSFAITGKLSNYSRREIKDLIEKNGGKVTSSVNSKLNYLLAGESPGSKLEKAMKLESVKIISVEEFLEIIK